MEWKVESLLYKDCCIVHESRLLNVNGWDMDQTRIRSIISLFSVCQGLKEKCIEYVSGTGGYRAHLWGTESRKKEKKRQKLHDKNELSKYLIIHAETVRLNPGIRNLTPPELLKCQLEGMLAAGSPATVSRRLAFALPATSGRRVDWQSQTAEIWGK